jgi:putative protease
MVEKQPIGKVTHFFDKISVAVVELTGNLKVGDTIEIETGEGPFQQKVDSMQVDHKSVEEAKSGDAIGLKVDNPVREGNQVNKVTE